MYELEDGKANEGEEGKGQAPKDPHLEIHNERKGMQARNETDDNGPAQRRIVLRPRLRKFLLK